MTNFKGLCRLALAALAIPAVAQLALAVNYIPLKPDSANDAPATVFGSPTPGISIGKTTAPSGAMDIVGDLNVTGTITGSVSAASIDSTKLASNAVTTAKIASGAVDTTKLKSGSLDTGKIACFKADASIGFCASALTGGSSPICTSCQ